MSGPASQTFTYQLHGDRWGPWAFRHTTLHFRRICKQLHDPMSETQTCRLLRPNCQLPNDLTKAVFKASPQPDWGCGVAQVTRIVAVYDSIYGLLRISVR